MRICTARQMAAIDRETIAGGVAGLDLMEQAGRALTDCLLKFLAGMDDSAGHGCGGSCGHDSQETATAPTVLIVCGKGNNGGDGLVMARLLAHEGVSVSVLMLAANGELSPDAQVNQSRLPGSVKLMLAASDAWSETFRYLAAEADVVVDAIFGTGITPPLRNSHATLIRTLNSCGLPCFAVDIPSGVNGDDGRADPVAVAADVTATVGLPKRGLLLPPGRDFAGEIRIVDMDFEVEVCERHAPDVHWRSRAEYLSLLPSRRSWAHKYECGRLLVVAGSKAFGGAAHLATLGGLRSGAGLVTIAAPKGLETPLRVGLPEAIVIPLDETDVGTLAPVPPAVTAGLLAREMALALGPGLGSDPGTDAWVCDLVAALPIEVPLVLDADGLVAFSRAGRPLDFHGRPVVLTPHPGEFARLTGETPTDIAERPWELASKWAMRWGAVVLLKGSPACIADPGGQVDVNPTGDDALARGGSGDVLTGLIGGLLAQGATPRDAALLGAYVHGLAGTRAAGEMSSRAVLMREIAASIGPVWMELEQEASGSASLRERIWPTDAPGSAR